MPKRSAQSFNSFLSRRKVLVAGGALGTVSALSACNAARQTATSTPSPSQSSQPDSQGEIAILNNALFYEHQAIWAYGTAAGKLTNTAAGQAVLKIAQRNKADHERHRDLLAGVVQKLGGTPVSTETEYDISSYLQKQEGNLDNDINIAKLALALEVDAAIAYTTEIAMLKTPDLITAGASIGSNESAHATAIRAAFNALGIMLPVVPAPLVNAENREAWILKV